MKINDQYSFLEHRKNLERDYFDNPDNLDHQDIIKSISSVDITTIDLCNRSCVFCPRHNPAIYPNRNLRMTQDGASIISKKLQDIDFRGTIAISGFGENLLNPELVSIVNVLRNYNPQAFIECNTNGDHLKKHLLLQLISAGLDCININLYDSPDQIDKFDKMLEGVSNQYYKYRAHWNTDDFGIIFNNRSGMVNWIDEYSNIDELKNKPCYYPFYKLMIDWNGDVLFCANDWGRTRVVGNLLQQSIKEIWLGKHMDKIRMRLANGNRNFKPCNTCNINGTLVGKKSFDILMDHYNENSNNRNK